MGEYNDREDADDIWEYDPATNKTKVTSYKIASPRRVRQVHIVPKHMV